MGHTRKWTPEEDQLLRELISQGLDSNTIGQRIGRPTAGVIQRASNFNLKIRGRKGYTHVFTPPADEDWDKLNRQGCDSLLAALQEFHPGGAAYVIEKPTKGGPRRYTPEPRLMYRSSAAACAEG